MSISWLDNYQTCPCGQTFSCEDPEKCYNEEKDETYCSYDCMDDDLNEEYE